jgi:flagellar motility protein MotE (MotC chaperone)
LPIVIAATAALLLFKGVGIVTQGGYSLVGTTAAVAAGGAPAPAEHGGSGGGGGAEASGGESHGGEASMTDQSPTLEDHSVTMEFPSEEAAADGGHGAAPAEDAGHGEAPEVGPAEGEASLGACPPTDAAATEAGGHGEAAPAAPEAASAAEGGHGAAAAEAEGPVDPCKPNPGVNEHGDALPLVNDSTTGKLVPLADTLKDESSENAINERLAERRTDLDARETELDMRAALLDAAEKRIEERSAELKALEEKISKLVEDNKTAEQQQFVSLVAMYENMKPKDAATIFDQLDMPVLLGVAKAMNPRKMAPILARMNPLKAKALTDGIAADEAPEPVATEAAAEDLTNLPQIVGQ